MWFDLRIWMCGAVVAWRRDVLGATVVAATAANARFLPMAVAIMPTK